MLSPEPAAHSYGQQLRGWEPDMRNHVHLRGIAVELASGLLDEVPKCFRASGVLVHPALPGSWLNQAWQHPIPRAAQTRRAPRQPSGLYRVPFQRSVWCAAVKMDVFAPTWMMQLHQLSELACAAAFVCRSAPRRQSRVPEPKPPAPPVRAHQSSDTGR